MSHACGNHGRPFFDMGHRLSYAQEAATPRPCKTQLSKFKFARERASATVQFPLNIKLPAWRTLTPHLFFSLGSFYKCANLFETAVAIWVCHSMSERRGHHTVAAIHTAFSWGFFYCCFMIIALACFWPLYIITQAKKNEMPAHDLLQCSQTLIYCP